MGKPSRILKKVYDLTQDDFRAHPIWSWAETLDESLVAPVEYNGALDEDHDALFVACDYVLADGTTVPGTLAVGAESHRVNLLKFPTPEQGVPGRNFFDVPLQHKFTPRVTAEELASFLGKRVSDVFPLEYRTPFRWPNGELLVGRVASI